MTRESVEIKVARMEEKINGLDGKINSLDVKMCHEQAEIKQLIQTIFTQIDNLKKDLNCQTNIEKIKNIQNTLDMLWVKITGLAAIIFGCFEIARNIIWKN